LFEKITIIGLGLIGGSLAAAFKRKNISAEIIGVDENVVLEKASAAGLIASGFGLGKIEQAVGGADLIFLATPIQSVFDLLPHVGKYAKAGTLISDVGSTKRLIVAEAAKCLPANVYFLGGHPMTGSEKKGLDAADPFLFENSYYVIAESPDVPTTLQDGFVRLIEYIGAKVICMQADVHDEVAAVVSHLPQLLAVALMTHVASLNDENSMYLKLAAGGFQDMTRVASSPYSTWEHILKTNTGNIRRALDSFVGTLTDVGNLIADDSLEQIFERAARDRLSIPKDMRGFMHPHFDVSVVVEDKPGILAEITGILAGTNLNIKDIEILKVREGDAGTLRMAFASKQERQEAVRVLRQRYFQVTERD